MIYLNEKLVGINYKNIFLNPFIMIWKNNFFQWKTKWKELVFIISDPNL